MTGFITTTIQQCTGRIGQAAEYARTGWAVAMALIAVIGGISTLNLTIAHLGMATLNDVASPFMQQFARLGREA
jgi:hypothetical protein